MLAFGFRGMMAPLKAAWRQAAAELGPGEGKIQLCV